MESPAFLVRRATGNNKWTPVPARGTGDATVVLTLLSIVAGILLAGCGKSGQSSPQPDSLAPKVDVAKLRAAFPSPSPEIQTALRNVVFSVRYSRFTDTESELQTLAANPSLTDAQKQAVATAKDQADKAQAAADAAAAKARQ